MLDHPPEADRHDIFKQCLDTSHGGVGKDGLHCTARQNPSERDDFHSLLRKRCDIIKTDFSKEDVMSLAVRQKNNHIKVKQYITDAKGQKVAAILDIKEVARVNDLIEDLLDLKTIENRIAEPTEDYEAYSRKRKSRLHV